jgi:hypothetical protein
VLYWQVETSQIQSDPYGSPIRSLYAPASDYVGFDFTDTWGIIDSQTTPYLQDLVIDAKNYITALRKYAWDGKGLSGTPYLIKTEADLSEIRNDQHAYYQLDNDITITTAFTPIPDMWDGGLDGNGYNIIDFTLPVATTGGLYAAITHSGIVFSNLTFKDINLVGTANYRAALIGQLSADVTLDAVNINGGTISRSTGNRSYYGGLVAYAVANTTTTITNCSVAVDLTAYQYVGGLVGQSLGTVNIENCSYNGTITSNSTNVGGLVGSAVNTTIDGSSVTGGITATNYAGGLAGQITTSGAITNSTNSNMSIVSTGSYVGGLVGLTANITITNGQSSGTVSGASYVGGLVGSATSTTITSSQSSGAVSGTSYIGGLAGRTITASSISQSHATGDITGTGTHVGGLVGHTTATSPISDSYATGDVVGTQYAGGLVGYSQASSITTSYALGDVTGTTYVGGLTGSVTTGPVNLSFARGNVTGTAPYVGGLIGYSTAPISEVYASGDVTSNAPVGTASLSVGGLVGYQYSTATNVYALGNVSSPNNSLQVGGLIGYVRGNITNAYSIGTVTTDAGVIDGQAVIGYRYAGTATNLYWHTETSHIFTDAYAQPLYSLYAPASDYVNFDFTDIWDTQPNITVPYFQNVALDPKNYISNAQTHPWEGSGTEVDPYLLKAADDVDAIRENIFAYYQMANDIDMSGYGAIRPIPTFMAGGIDGAGYTLSNLTVQIIKAGSGFIETISDPSIIIKDLTLDNINYAGNFADIGGIIGTVTASDLTLDGVNVTSGTIQSTQANLGGLIGSYSGAGALTVTNCQVGVNFTSGSSIGGLVGNTGTGQVVVDNCTYFGTMAGSTYVGGLLGQTQNASVSNSTVNGAGDITASGNYSGGIIGISTVGNLSIDNVLVSKNLLGAGSYKGGIIGSVAGASAPTATITSAITTGNITGGSYLGGLIGNTANSITTNVGLSYATGAVTGAQYVGGLIGYLYNGSINIAYASGNVTGTTGNVGGLIGYNRSAPLTNVYALGNVYSTSGVAGGLVGTNYTSDITNAYSVGNVNAPATDRQATIGTLSGTSAYNGIYWNVEASNLFDDSAGKGLASLYAPEAEYVGFDFTSVWDLTTDTTLPYLQDLAVDSKNYITEWVDYTYAGKGLVNNPYQIYDATDLSNIRNNPYAYYQVMNDLTMAGNWTQIPKAYAGGIDGGGHTLDGLSVVSAAAGQGFISNVVGDYTMKNWNLTNLSITGNHTPKALIPTASAGTLNIDALNLLSGSVAPATAQTNTGALVGLVSGATVNLTNITSAVSVNGTTYTGGLIGRIVTGSASLSGIQVTGDVTGTTNYIGGLIGATAGTTTINNATVTAIITGTGTYHGGMVGAATVGITLTNSTINKPVSGGDTISGTNYIGGAIGAVSGGGLTLQNVSSNVNISGTGTLGGLVGTSTFAGVENSLIKDSFSTGSVTGTGTVVGGLIGTLTAGTINDSYATGNVSGTSSLGGLVGVLTAGVVDGVHATGDVQGTGTLGGLIGSSPSITLSNSYATGNVTGTATVVGGLVGTITAGVVDNVYAKGNVSGTGTLGGLVGYFGTAATSTLTLAYATGNVTGTTTLMGGLVGQNYATLSKVYASGNVTNNSTATVATALYVGGLAGYHYVSPISDAFALGQVTAPTNYAHTYIAGLLGRTTGDISNSYFGGTVNGTGTPATRQILIGYKAAADIITNVYWYTDRSGVATSPIGGSPVTEASTAIDFVGFDFTTIWSKDSNSMPYLTGLAIDNKVYY